MLKLAGPHRLEVRESKRDTSIHQDLLVFIIADTLRYANSATLIGQDDVPSGRIIQHKKPVAADI